MNVPPLITAAVSATANAPSDRFPRKYFWRNPALRLATRLASTPIPSETRVKTTRATSVAGWAWTAAALFMQAALPDVGLELRGVVLTEVVVGHEEPGEP